MDIHWTGPYEVVEDLGKLRYKVKSQKTGKLLKSTVHCCRLKHYIKPATDIDEPARRRRMEKKLRLKRRNKRKFRGAARGGKSNHLLQHKS